MLLAPDGPVAAAVSRAAAERAYAARRAEAFAAAQAKVTAAGIAAEIRPVVDPAALDAFAADWRDHPARRVAWPWPEMLARFRRDYPARFELAVWREGRLRALALGRPSASPLHCAVHYIERDPDPGGPLRSRVVPVVLEALQSYAETLGKAELRLMEPLPGLVAYYQRFGFNLVTPKREAQYLVRKVVP